MAGRLLTVTSQIRPLVILLLLEKESLAGEAGYPQPSARQGTSLASLLKHYYVQANSSNFVILFYSSRLCYGMKRAACGGASIICVMSMEWNVETRGGSAWSRVVLRSMRT